MRREKSEPERASDTPGVERLQAQLRALLQEHTRLVEEQHLLEQARHDAAELYDGAPVSLVTLDSAGTIQSANAAAWALLGVKRSPVDSRLQKFVRGAGARETLADHLRRCRREPHEVTSELRIGLGRKGGSTVQLRSRRAAGARRRFATALIELGTDAEAQRARYAEAVQAAQTASDAKDYFIAMLSHELRTPLTPVLLALPALMNAANLPEPLRLVCAMIQRNVATEARLLDDLLDATRIARGKLRLEREPMDVHEAIKLAIELLSEEATARRVTIEHALEAEAFWANADPVRLRQVLWNLLRNAIKFSPPGGRIDVRSWNSGPRVAVEVSDEGAGFAPEATSRLFKAFEQERATFTSGGGLGLGLAICKGLMDLHGGAIQGASRGPGLGARFVIELPTVPAPLASAAAAAVARPPIDQEGKRGARVLVVEDHEDTAEALHEMLSQAGYEVRTAIDVRSALTVDLAEIDVLVSDIGLPDASGHELMRQVAARRPTKGIALSGFGTEADVRASRDAGFSAHLTKPVDPAILLATLESFTRDLTR